MLFCYRLDGFTDQLRRIFSQASKCIAADGVLYIVCPHDRHLKDLLLLTFLTVSIKCCVGRLGLWRFVSVDIALYGMAMVVERAVD